MNTDHFYKFVNILVFLPLVAGDYEMLFVRLSKEPLLKGIKYLFCSKIVQNKELKIRITESVRRGRARQSGPELLLSDTLSST